MPRAVECVHDGVVIGTEAALELRDGAREAGRAPPEFECQLCGEAVRVHRAGGAAGAHFEHFVRNPECPNSATQ